MNPAINIKKNMLNSNYKANGFFFDYTIKIETEAGKNSFSPDLFQTKKSYKIRGKKSTSFINQSRFPLSIASELFQRQSPFQSPSDVRDFFQRRRIFSWKFLNRLFLYFIRIVKVPSKTAEKNVKINFFHF